MTQAGHSGAELLAGRARDAQKDRPGLTQDDRAKKGPAGFSTAGTNCVPIGDLGLKRGQRITYFFDYGDCHEFEVVVKAVKDQREECEYPRILESAGKAPEQYPGSDHQHRNGDW